LSVSWPVPIIIAAGGAGQRMAANKPAQMLGGTSLIDRAFLGRRTQIFARAADPLRHAVYARRFAGAAVAMAKSGDRFHPICALWSIEALSALPEHAQNSRRSLIGFAERLGLTKVE
jgi:molybdopterin-guanine dinucleotide biosynthesis protein A